MANATRPEPSLREDPWHVDNCSMPRLRLALRSVCAGAAGAFAVSGDICGIGRIQRLLDDLSPGFVARGSIAMSQMTNRASHATEGYTITLAWA